jgi:hypothetical protein
MKYIAYLMDNDTVAYGLGAVFLGDTKEEAIAKLRADWEDSRDTDHEDPSVPAEWEDCVQDGEGVLGWGTDKMRLFVTEVK